jgi:hypothetical protein
MIVIAETNSGMKKLFLRDRIFSEIDTNNKKIPNGVVRSTNIQNILWLDHGTSTKVPLAKFLENADASDYWGVDD